MIHLATDSLFAWICPLFAHNPGADSLGLLLSGLYALWPLIAAGVLVVFARRVRFRGKYLLRSPLVFMLILAIACGCFATRLYRAHRQREAAEAIARSGGRTRYDYDLGEPSGVGWRRTFTDFFMGVVDARVNDDTGVEHLEGLPYLESLTLSGDVTDRGLEQFEEMILRGRLTHLDNLEVTCKVTDAGLAHLDRLAQLQQLSLEYTRLTDAGLQHLEPLANLRYLRLTGDGFTNVGLHHLRPLVQLETLSLSSTRITDPGLENLKGLTRLRHLYLYGCTEVSGDGVRNLKKSLPDLVTAGGGQQSNGESCSEQQMQEMTDRFRQLLGDSPNGPQTSPTH